MLGCRHLHFMRRYFAALVIALTACGFAGDSTARGQEPPRLIERVPALYPSAAQAAGVEGPVTFLATVRPDGTVASVRILSVPKPGVGFEESVDAAVRRWRFAPTVPGVDRLNTAFEGSIDFQLTLPREWMYSVDSRTAWTQVLAVAQQRRMHFNRRDDQHQVLITDFLTYRGGGFPEADQLLLPRGQLPTRIQFHIHVTPGLEPARVAIGSIIETLPISSIERSGWTVYANETASDWFLSQLTARIGRAPERLAASPERRAQQSKRLMPAGIAESCAVNPAPFVSSEESKRLNLKATALTEVKPIYPKSVCGDSIHRS